MTNNITIVGIHRDVWWISNGIIHDGNNEIVAFQILKNNNIVCECHSEDEVKLYCLKNGYPYHGVDYCDY